MRRALFSIILLASLCSCSSRGKQRCLPEEDTSGFCCVTDSVPDAILEIRYYSTYNFIGKRIDGYEAPIALITKEAAGALRKAAGQLMAKGYRIKVFDAYRPQCAVDMFMRWAADLDDTSMKPYFYPDLTKNRLIPEEYIMEKSGHTRGSTIDLTLFDMAKGCDVDMGAPFDWFGELSHPDYPVGGKPGLPAITEEQYGLRQLLRETMIASGFKPIDSEWWHFTLANEPYPNTYFTFPVRQL
ncbi:MAG: M15 family metallopeptidase [Bacteroidales bacterium]|nr:M15 family metallopeptidase [Bacteroidales bacterium]